MREAVEHYLRAMGGIHATGAAVKETSYYPALADLGLTRNPAHAESTAHHNTRASQ